VSPTVSNRRAASEEGADGLVTGVGPHVRALERTGSLMQTLLACTAALAFVGWAFYGPRVLWLALVGIATSALTEWACCWLTERRSAGGFAHSLAMGLLVVLMLPATAPWYVAAVGAALAVGVGKWLMGGLGHYPWHPAVVARAAVQMLWPALALPERWPLLAPRHVFTGEGFALRALEPTTSLGSWMSAEPAGQTIGFAMLDRPDGVLHEVAQGTLSGPGGPMVTALRDLLPSWWDMLIGAVPGNIGEGAVLILAAVGLILVWRGYLRWGLPVAVLVGAASAAAILPVGGTTAMSGWLPIRHFFDGIPVGLMWVGYHVFAGPTLFAAVVLAGETVTSPVTGRAQTVYGFGVGVLTVALRWWPVALTSAYWAVLAMNTLTPAIDAADRRLRLQRGRQP